MQADEWDDWRGFMVQPGAPGAGVVVLYLGQTLPHCFRSILGGSVYVYGGYLFGGVSVDESVDLVGLGIPFLVYGLCLPLAEAHHKVNGVLFGMMFIAVALSFSIIQVWQIRRMERQHESN